MVRLEYPFPVYALNQPQLALVGEELDRLAQRHDLFPTRAAWRRIIQTFVGYCSPERPTNECLRTLTHFLYLTFFFSEGRSGVLPRELVLDYRAVLGGAASNDSHPVLRCAQEFRARLVELHLQSGADASGFFHYLDLNLSAFLRDATREPDAEIDLETALARRLHTISALGYFEFWKLLLGVPHREELPYASDIFRCQLLSAKIQGLANDLGSVSKDERDGSPNLVLTLARERSLSLQQASEHALAWHDRTLSEYVAATDGLLARVAEPAVRRYVEFIRSCTRGNWESVLALTQRYG